MERSEKRLKKKRGGRLLNIIRKNKRKIAGGRVVSN